MREVSATREVLSAQNLLAAADLPFVLLFAVVVAAVGGALVWIPLGMGALVLVSSALLQRASLRRQREATAATRARLATLMDVLAARESLHGRPLAHSAESAYRRQAQVGARAAARARWWAQLQQQMVPVLIAATSVAMMVGGVFQVEAQALSVGGLISVNMLGIRLLSSLCSAAPLAARWREFSRALQGLADTVDLQAAPLAAVQPAAAGHGALAGEGLRLEDLHFTWPGASRPVLDGLNLQLQTGQTVALVGASGAGKSTLLRVLAGQLPHTGGKLVVGAHVVGDDTSRHWLCHLVQHKPQDPCFLGGTLAEVVAAGAPGATDASLVAALRRAGLGPALDRGDLGLNTPVGTNGAGLSGGQRQMVALAISFHASQPVLLLDEPTLGLDRSAQERVLEALPTLAQGRCVVIATHAAEVIQRADRVLVLDRGRVVADGPPDRLLAAAGPCQPARHGHPCRPAAARGSGGRMMRLPASPLAHAALAVCVLLALPGPQGAVAAITTPPAWRQVAAAAAAAAPAAGSAALSVPMVMAAAAPAAGAAPAVPAASTADTAAASPNPDPARVLRPLADAGRTVLATGQQLAIDAWLGTREMAADLLPLGMPRRTAGVSALSLARPLQARTLRLGELPGLLGVAATLPLGDAAAPPSTQPATQATQDGSRPISLQQAIDLGVQHSLEVQAAAARRESFEQTAVAARGALLPRVDGRLAVGTGQLDSVSPAERRARKDGSLVLRQTLFDLPAEREVQRQDVLTDSARLQWQAAVSSASLQVSSSYLQALQARITLELGVSHERLLGDLLDYVGRRADAGGTSIAERDRVKARVANARAQQADARANLRSALRQLATLIGEAPAQLALDMPGALAVPLDATAALGEARLANRDLVASRTEAEAAALEARAQRARMLPRVELELSHNRAVNAGGIDSYSRDTKAQLVVNWSLLNGGTDLAQGRAAAARMREKELLSDDLERKLGQDLEASYASLDAVAERFAALRDELLANRSVVDAFQAQLVGGNRPLLDVLDAYQRLHQSRLDLAQLVLGEVINHAKVAHITGRLAPAGSRP